jgi:hypothetical protein
MGEHDQAPEIRGADAVELSAVDPDLLGPLDKPLVDHLAEDRIVADRTGTVQTTEPTRRRRVARPRRAPRTSPVGTRDILGFAPGTTAVWSTTASQGNRAAEVPSPVGQTGVAVAFGVSAGAGASRSSMLGSRVVTRQRPRPAPCKPAKRARSTSSFSSPCYGPGGCWSGSTPSRMRQGAVPRDELGQARTLVPRGRGAVGPNRGRRRTGAPRRRRPWRRRRSAHGRCHPRYACPGCKTTSRSNAPRRHARRAPVALATTARRRWSSPRRRWRPATRSRPALSASASAHKASSSARTVSRPSKTPWWLFGSREVQGIQSVACDWWRGTGTGATTPGNPAGAGAGRSLPAPLWQRVLCR